MMDRPDRLEQPVGEDVLTDAFMSTVEVAALIGVNAATLRRWRSAEPPMGPPFVPISERVTKYCKVDLRRWIDAHRVATVSPTYAVGSR